MATDISNNAVAVLLVLVVVVAAVGTWAFLSEFESVERHDGPSFGSGEVRLSLAGSVTADSRADADVALTVAHMEE